MGNFRFYRRVRIFPGLSVNLSKSGPSVSVGMRGAHVTFGPKGIQRTVGIPGTGIYYTSRSGHYSGLHSAHVETPIEPDQQAAAHRMAEILMALALLTFVALLATTLIL